MSHVLADVARRGIIVRALLWRSHLDRFRYHEAENRKIGEQIHAAGGDCILDMRVRGGGSHHQKMVILRHPGRPELDVAFLGGIGFTMSLFIAGLAFGEAARLDAAKLGILAASLTAGLVGFAVLRALPAAARTPTPG